MKGRMIFKKISIIITVAMFVLLFTCATVNAATKSRLISNKELYFDWYDADDSADGKVFSNTFKVNVPTDGILIISIENKKENIITSGGVRVELFDPAGTRLQNDYIALDDAPEEFTTWFYNDNLVTKSGMYEYRITSTVNDDMTLLVDVDLYGDIAKSASIKKSVKVKNGQWAKIGKINNGAPICKSFKISNKKAIPELFVETDGNVYVYGKKTGTSKISIKLNNGKTYNCKATVSGGEPDFFAKVVEYNTRDNYFTVKYMNVGVESIVIHPNGAYSFENGSKSYDRTLRVAGGKNITVKPNKSRKIRFYVNGNTTWPNYKSHTIRYYFTYAGKKYLGSTWYNGSSLQKKGKWFTTYWKESGKIFDDWFKKK